MQRLQAVAPDNEVESPGQSPHTPCPDSALKVPAGHGRHSLAALPLNCPTVHAVHSSEDPALIKPASHAVQVVAAVARVVLKPPPQSLHDELATPAWNCPIGHAVHDVEPGSEANVPCPQSAQLGWPWLSVYFPGELRDQISVFDRYQGKHHYCIILGKQIKCLVLCVP